MSIQPINGKVTIGGTAKEISTGYANIGGVWKSIAKSYVNIGGVWKDNWLNKAMPISELPVGTVVKLNVDGVATDFIIVHQGNPDSTIYDTSCNGTWLLMKDIYTTNSYTIIYKDYDYEYAGCAIHEYLNDTFMNLLDSNVKSAIIQAKIPYSVHASSKWTERTVLSGSNGLSTKAFLLSYTETGFSGDSYAAVEGATLDYFYGSDASTRIAYLDGGAMTWWTRTTCTRKTAFAFYISTKGAVDDATSANGRGIRPALILPSDILVDDTNNIIA